jgi:segregation and condensation protein B
MSESDEDVDEVAKRHLRILEAVLFAAREPLDLAALGALLGPGAPIEQLLADLQRTYASRGINLVRRGEGWAFRTAEDLAFLLRRDEVDTRPLSRAALETLAIVAYHQPVTRAEIEDIRGVAAGKGTLDILMETGWIKMRGRRRSPGRPVTYGTTPAFLDHFSLESLGDLPGLDDLKGAGLLASGYQVPLAFGGADDDEEPLAPGDTGD